MTREEDLLARVVARQRREREELLAYVIAQQRRFERMDDYAVIFGMVGLIAVIAAEVFLR